MQKINNYIQSEQLKRNGRKPESSKSIRSLYIRAGRTCYLKVLPLLFAGLLLSNCAIKDYNLNPFTTVMNQVIKTQYTKEKTNE
jgi:hypothetical protein